MKSLVNKVMSIKALVALMIICATSGAWADFQKTNPVTGETENYTWKFTGTDTWNGTDYWQNSDGGNPSKVPHRAYTEQEGGNTVWDPILFDASEDAISISAGMAVAGWNLRMGLYNGATITLYKLQKLQSDAVTWFTVDETSQLTIGVLAGDKLEGSNPLCLYSARANGITWTPALSNSAIGDGVQMPLHYYLAGDGTVAFKGVITLTSAQVIKQADVTLSEATSSKTVRSKTLVSFASTSTSTFSADAETTIKVKNSDGTALKDVNLTSVTATDTTLTTAGNVGDCELVQTSTGVVLYYVDYAKAYKPSININFTNGAGNGLTTSADVGLGDYAIPGTSWNNLAGNNGSLSALNAADSSGATFATAASVAITEARGSYSCSSLTSASDLRHGYIDESTSGLTPTITVSGIPYEKYRVIVYTATDAASKTFGYLTINGKNYTYVNSALTEDTTAWGASGGQNTAEQMAEGVNVLVSPVTLGSTLTVVGHRDGDNTRGCIAAIQIVEYVPEVTENDLVIPVMGPSATYTVSKAKELSGTVYLVGNGTLTLDGSAKITASTIDVGANVTLNINADRLDATTFTGLGTVVYDGIVPPTGKGWTDSAWAGTVWIKNKSGITGNTDASTGVQPNSLGNSLSKVKFSGVSGWLEAPVTYNPEIVLENAGYDYALQLTNGNSPDSNNGDRCIIIQKLSGSGTLGCGGNTYAWPLVQVWDATEFTGSINTSNANGNGEGRTGLVVVFCAEDTTFSDTLYALFKGVASGYPHPHSIYVASGTTVTQSSTATWNAVDGFGVDGTLNVDGTLASSHTTKAVSGAGTVVFTGRAPTVSGDAWWKNADWTGTVQVKDVTNMVGDSRTGVWLKFNDYGNSGSVVEMNNVTGWLETGYTCTPKIKITGTLYLNNGGSGKASAFKVGTLLGSGTISGDGSAVTVVFNITDDWSGFTGTIGLNNKCIVFGETIPDELTAGTIYISEGAVVTPQQSSGVWWGVGGIKVDGELRAPNLDKFGGGTSITTTDNGVFTFITNSNADDMNVDYARLQGTGTLRLEGTAYRCISTNNFPTAMTVDNRLTAGYLHRISGLEITIGSLAGDGYLRSDWGGSAGDRSLKVLQSKDTTWSGKFWTSNPHRLGSLIVAPGANTAGTLTLSAKHEAEESTGLTVESGAAVNLTGTWVGATTVAGTIGGTGTLTGNLTFNAGSTFKANATALTVTGAVAFPAGPDAEVTVDLTGVTPVSGGTTLISSSTSMGSAINLTAAGAALKVVGNDLKVYPIVATYGGKNYATFADAIDVALADEGGEANLASITVVDATAELPAGYLIVDNHVIKAQGAIVDTNGTAHYYATAQAAVDAVDSYLYGTVYDYFAVYYGNDVGISINPSKLAWTYGGDVKVKCLNDSTVVVTLDSDEYTLDPSEPEDGIVTYSKIAVATTYVWVGATSDGDTSAAKQWDRPSNWRVGTSVGATASRSPSPIDTANLVGGAYVTRISVAESLTITGSGTLTSTGAISLTTSGATISVTGVTLDPAPTSGVDLMYVKTTNSEGATTYALQSAGSVVDGVATITDATAEVTVPASATAIEAAPAVSSIKLEAGSEIKKSDITIKYNGTTDITGAFTVTVADNQVTIALNAGGSVTFNEDTEDEETVSVTPTVATTDPMTMAGVTTAPSFNIKTIPGLYYAVKSGTSPNDLSAVSASQEATTTTTEIAGTALGNAETVRYYQISVGRTAAEAAEAEQ